MATKTVKVTNVSLSATEHDIREFFSFSGQIEGIELRNGNERSQIAYVTFKETQGAETAILLSGATIVGQSVSIDSSPEYKLPAPLSKGTEEKMAPVGESAIQKAEYVVSTMLAKGFVLGKDALNKAKSFDEKHGFTSNASSTVNSLDQKIGFTEKFSAGSSIVNNKVREVDEKFRVSESTKSAFTAAEKSVGNTGSAIMKNRYILTGTSWVTGAFKRVTKTVGDFGEKTKVKILAEEEQARKAEGSSTATPGEHTSHFSQ